MVEWAFFVGVLDVIELVSLTQWRFGVCQLSHIALKYRIIQKLI